MKRCGRCGNPKDEKEFHKNRRSRDGRCSACIECARASRNRHPVCPICGGPTREGRCAPCLASFGTKWCPGCRALRPIGEFRRDRTRAGGRASLCRLHRGDRKSKESNGNR